MLVGEYLLLREAGTHGVEIRGKRALIRREPGDIAEGSRCGDRDRDVLGDGSSGRVGP